MSKNTFALLVIVLLPFVAIIVAAAPKMTTAFSETLERTFTEPEPAAIVVPMTIEVPPECAGVEADECIPVIIAAK